MSIQDKQQEIISEFSKFSSWEEKYKRLIELGKTLPSYPDEFRDDKFKVKGCQSQVWLHPNFNGEVVLYDIDSDAMIVKGLAAILHQTFNGHTPKEITDASMDFLTEIGLTSHLSQSRSNGLAAMVRQFKNYALAFQMLQQK